MIVSNINYLLKGSDAHTIKHSSMVYSVLLEDNSKLLK